MKRILLYAPAHLKIPLAELPAVGPKQAQTLAESKFRITSVQELLQHYPRRHLDFSDTRLIREVRAGDEVTILGEIKRVQAPHPRNRRAPLKVSLYDGTSYMTLAFFNQPWRAKQLKPGTLVAAKGKISVFRSERQMTSPLIDVIKEAGEAIKIVPQYPATADIHTAWFRRVIRAALDRYELADPLPEALLNRQGLAGRNDAMGKYHFPQEMGQKVNARRRLVFDELFTLQLGLAFRKHRIERDTAGIALRTHDLADQFLKSLPFELTTAQQRVAEEMREDMGRRVPMHRLLQGEVGSGKTVLAVYAALIAVESGYQVAIMAPTEVLAGQHFITITELLEPLGFEGSVGQLGLFGQLKVALLTGSTGAAKRRQNLAALADGSSGIAVGTHALIQEGVEFKNLGLAIVDEQHRFGVRQRVALKEKTQRMQNVPDVLIMTATPIPRTLSLTLYGDLDVSILDELPKGRSPIKTAVLDESMRRQAYDLVRSEVQGGRQAYVITPLIEESDRVEAKSAKAEADRLAGEVFPDLRVGLMHGGMRPFQKEAVMDGFRRGEVDVLISTTVVEVGVDVPNATVMLIENADRFGLSQLHQLRGRIGRGAYPSTCLLLAGQANEGEEQVPARRRLEVMESTLDGFELANKDLEFRGTGTILGERQSGYSDLKLTQLLKDVDLLNAARKEAFSMIEIDPDLSRHPEIRLEMEGRFADRLDWLFRS